MQAQAQKQTIKSTSNKKAASQAPIPTFHRGLDTAREERSYKIDNIEGDWPKDLRGSFYRNGPGRLERGGKKYGHWFDGDGMMNAFHMREDGMHYVNKYVRTEKFVEEEKAGKILYRGIGTQIPGGFWKNTFKAPVTAGNTSVVYHGDKLMALAEGWWPYEIDADNLNTVGPHNFEGQLKMNQAFSAHGKVHPKTGDYFNFGFGVDVRNRRPVPVLNFYRVDPTGKMKQKKKITLPRMAFLHDFAMSENYAFFIVNSIGAKSYFDVAKSMLGFSSLSKLMSYKEDLPALAMIVDLNTMELVFQAEMEAHAVVHFGNAWEDNGMLHVQAMYFNDFSATDSLGNMWKSERMESGKCHTYHVNLKDQSITHEEVSDSGLECEFPQWQNSKNTQESRYLWMAANSDNGACSFFNAIQKVDTKTTKTIVCELPKGYYGSEPMPILNGEKEDDGYVLMVVYNAFEHLSELWCLDAHDLSIRAKAFLPHHIPHGFHGYWLDATRRN